MKTFGFPFAVDAAFVEALDAPTDVPGRYCTVINRLSLYWTLRLHPLRPGWVAVELRNEDPTLFLRLPAFSNGFLYAPDVSGAFPVSLRLRDVAAKPWDTLSRLGRSLTGRPHWPAPLRVSEDGGVSGTLLLSFRRPADLDPFRLLEAPSRKRAAVGTKARSYGSALVCELWDEVGTERHGTTDVQLTCADGDIFAHRTVLFTKSAAFSEASQKDNEKKTASGLWKMGLDEFPKAAVFQVLHHVYKGTSAGALTPDIDFVDAIFRITEVLQLPATSDAGIRLRRFMEKVLLKMEMTKASMWALTLLADREGLALLRNVGIGFLAKWVKAPTEGSAELRLAIAAHKEALDRTQIVRALIPNRRCRSCGSTTNRRCRK